MQPKNTTFIENKFAPELNKSEYFVKGFPQAKHEYQNFVSQPSHEHHFIQPAQNYPLQTQASHHFSPPHQSISKLVSEPTILNPIIQMKSPAKSPKKLKVDSIQLSSISTLDKSTEIKSKKAANGSEKVKPKSQKTNTK